MPGTGQQLPPARPGTGTLGAAGRGDGHGESLPTPRCSLRAGGLGTGAKGRTLPRGLVAQTANFWSEQSDCRCPAVAVGLSSSALAHQGTGGFGGSALGRAASVLPWAGFHPGGGWRGSSARRGAGRHQGSFPWGAVQLRAPLCKKTSAKISANTAEQLGRRVAGQGAPAPPPLPPLPRPSARGRARAAGSSLPRGGRASSCAGLKPQLRDGELDSGSVPFPPLWSFLFPSWLNQ